MVFSRIQEDIFLQTPEGYGMMKRKEVRKMMKRVFCLLFAGCILLSLTACGLFVYDRYRGKHRELYTVAVNNVFGTKGYMSNGEVLYDPEICVLETDDYGRKLFFYSEYYPEVNSDTQELELGFGMAFLVMQKSEKGYVYYYRDECYIPYFDTEHNWDSISKKLDTAILEQLKELNDWNRPINTENCVKIKISDQKPNGKLCPTDDAFDAIIYPYEVKNGYTGQDKRIYHHSYYSETDAYGRELHYVFGMTVNKTAAGETEAGYYEYAIIFDTDGTCSEDGIVKITDIKESYAAISELKQKNNWNAQ